MLKTDKTAFNKISDAEINHIVSVEIFGEKGFNLNFCEDYSLLKFLYQELAADHCCIHVYSDYDYIHYVKLVRADDGSKNYNHEFHVETSSTSLLKALAKALILSRDLLKKKKKKLKIK